MNNIDEGVKGNSNLKAPDTKIAYSATQVEEFIKSSQDIVYFSKNHVKIINVDTGKIPLNLYPYQEEVIKILQDERFILGKMPRQVGKTTLACTYLLHEVLFNKDKKVAILANKEATAIEILDRIKLSYESLPKHLQQGVVEWNKKRITLENGSSIIAAATSTSSIRGMSFSIIFLDEFAHIDDRLAEDFFTSTYPVISSGKKTKVIIFSTPKGLNYFYKLWTDAVEGRSSYRTLEIPWNLVPGRDENWKEETIFNLGSPEKFAQEFECKFIGSADTLISSIKLSSMAHLNPVFQETNLRIYEKPLANHKYCMTVDVARGKGLDYSVFLVFDVTKTPYRQVAAFRSNTIEPMLFPDVIYKVAKQYNSAGVLIEVNDIGGQIADTLHYEKEYENIFYSETRGRSGQKMCGALQSSNKFGASKGVRTTKSLKVIGCSNLKTIIENDTLMIVDFDTIRELSRFVKNKQGNFHADSGGHDDTVICLMLLAWAVTQRYFKEDFMTDVKVEMFRDKTQQIMESLVPFGYVSDNMTNEESKWTDSAGTCWELVTDANKPFDFL